MRVPALLALVLAGCGASAPDPPATVERCGRAIDPAADREVVPAGLLPSGSELISAHASASSARAVVLVPAGLRRTFRAVEAGARDAGFEVVHTEYDGVDAELYLSGPAGPAVMRLVPLRRCPGNTEAVFQRSFPD